MSLQGLFYGLERVLHDLDEKEEQYPYGESVEKGQMLIGAHAESGYRQAKENGKARYATKYHRL